MKKYRNFTEKWSLKTTGWSNFELKREII